MDVDAREIADALMHGSSKLLKEVHTILQNEPSSIENFAFEKSWDLPDGMYERLKIENTLKMIVHARKLEESCLSETNLCTLPGHSVECMKELRRGGKLLGFQIAYREERYYPCWQFDDDWQPLSFLHRFIVLSEELGYTPRSLNYFITFQYFDEGKTPLEIILEGDEERALQLLRDSHDV